MTLALLYIAQRIYRIYTHNIGIALTTRYINEHTKPLPLQPTQHKYLLAPEDGRINV